MDFDCYIILILKKITGIETLIEIKENQILINWDIIVPFHQELINCFKIPNDNWVPRFYQQIKKKFGVVVINLENEVIGDDIGDDYILRKSTVNFIYQMIPKKLKLVEFLKL